MSDVPSLATLAIRSGQQRTHECEHSEPIFATSSYAFDNAAEAAAAFADQSDHHVYSRFDNPTVQAFERRLAALEGAPRAIATASGMAAIGAVTLSFLQSGDHVLAARGLFGSTTNWLCKYLARFNIDVELVDLADAQAWRDAVRSNTRMLFAETPTNPMMEMADIAALAEIANQANARLVIDNCFCTPILQQPIALGAHLVTHSATKYLDGQGRCVGGAVVCAQESDGDTLYAYMRAAGSCMSPFNAWTFVKGLETLALRMRAHCENAMALAQWLMQQPQVAQVIYPGLAHHPQHALAQTQMRGFGGMVSFRVAGGREQAWAVIDAIKMLSRTGNLGDVKTTITHPATTTHARVDAAQRERSGITDDVIRLSVGLEDIADIRADLAQAFAAMPR